ncbi:hypothetical protein IFM89_028444 [Coptis chinensis]|uniref:Anaphase-promoting complex subunit 6 n=1 Tax=Coptis chinensis TaxID=261450 RepID=A0A835IPQ4_9MAGN|nr:hypothetical protein IFM89_028444 [Coptis chinensis]
MREESIEKLRGVVRDCVSKHLYSSAIFFADKVAAFTSDPADIYMQAQALFLGRHYRRAFHLLNASQIVLRDLRFRYLAAKCLEELKEWDQCLVMLGDAKVDEYGNAIGLKDSNVMYLDKDGEDREINITSAICFLRGKANEELENRAEARKWYKAAIKADPLCYEALERLIENHMLKSEEESSLISSLKFAPEDKWLSSFYSCLIKKYDKESMVEAKFRKLEQETCDNNTASLPVACTLKNNTDLLACKAEYYHQSGEYQKCFELTSALLERDPFHLKSTLVHLTAAMELGHSNELLSLSHFSIFRALSWFAVGCYYYCIKKYGESRRFFSKATTLDGTFLPAWIGHGNAFAAQEEGDQAMSSFRTAARSFPGKYHEAVSYYEKALAISTRSLSTYAGLAYTYHLQDNYDAAITYYHKALWLKPDDQFCTDMLTVALVDECRSGSDHRDGSH